MRNRNMLKIRAAISVLFVALVLGFSTTASAEGYIGAKYAALDADTSGNSSSTSFSASFSTPALMLNAGKQITPYFAVEGRLGLGAGDDNGVGIDSYYGIFGRLGAPSTYTFAPYFQFGYGLTELETVTVNYDDEDLAYGIGANININDSTAVNVEYMNYYDETVSNSTNTSTLEVSGLAIGFQYKF